MPTFTESDVLNAVTLALGYLSETEFSTTNKQDALRRGLIQYSQFRPLRKIGSFTTEADVQQYDIGSSYSYLIGITGVFYGSGEMTDLNYLYNSVYSVYANTSAMRGIETLDHEALRVLDDRVISLIQSSQRYDYHKIDDNVVALIPIPTTIREIFFTYSIIRTFNDLRENDYQDIIDFTFLAAASSVLAARSKRPLQMNVPDLGFIMFQSSKFIAEQIAEVNKKLTNKFAVTSFITHG